MGRGPLAWIAPVLKMQEQDLVTLIGLDATVFLRVLRMMRNMFLVITVIGCGILIPINVTAKGSTSTTFISKVTPLGTFGILNWAMTVCAWLFDIVVAAFLWYNYRAVLKLRRQYFATPEYQASLHARTLMVRTTEDHGRCWLICVDQRYPQGLPQ